MNDWPPPPIPPHLGHAPGCMCTAHIKRMITINEWGHSDEFAEIRAALISGQSVQVDE